MIAACRGCDSHIGVAMLCSLAVAGEERFDQVIFRLLADRSGRRLGVEGADGRSDRDGGGRAGFAKL